MDQGNISEAIEMILRKLAENALKMSLITDNRFYRLYYERMIMRKCDRLLTRPKWLEVEVTNRCNSNCLTCIEQAHGGKNDMAFETFFHAARQARELGINHLTITGGEPFLNPNLRRMVNTAHLLGFKFIQLFTNGSLLLDPSKEIFKNIKIISSSGSRYIRPIFNLKINSITVSIDSAIPEEYERIRAGLDFDYLIDGIRTLKNSKERPFIRINMVASKHNEYSREYFKTFFREYADIIEICPEHNFAGLRTGRPSMYDPCHMMFNKLVVDPRGYLKKCSIDYREDQKFGNVGKNMLKRFLFGQLYKIKEAMMRRDFKYYKCEHCNYKSNWWAS